MKIYSWNMFFDNAEPERALAFIEESDWDVFCLQEVSEALLARLAQMPCFAASAQGRELLSASKRLKDYSVILSRLPVRAKGSMPLPSFYQRRSLVTEAFIRVMFALGLWRAVPAVDSRERFSYAEVEREHGLTRIINLHLPLADFPARAVNFEHALASFDQPLPEIVCGDFNLLESPKVSLLNWLFGGRLSDTLFWARERKDMEKRFAAHRLKNPLRGRITHPLGRSQLDHILVPRDCIVTKADVIADPHSSDHLPVMVEIAPARA